MIASRFGCRPPVTRTVASINVATYKGEWDANANGPILSTGVGTGGYVYKGRNKRIDAARYRVVMVAG